MNRTKFFLYTILSLIATTVITGSVLQTFMLEKGFSEESVGLYFSIMQMIQIVTMLFLSKWVDGIKNVIKATASMYIFYIPFVLCLAILCFIDVDGMFLILTGIGIVVNLAIGLINVLTYKIPYHIMDMKNYGTWSGIAGILSGVVAFAFSVLLTFLQKKFAYFEAMKYIFAIALIASSLLVIVVFSYKRVENNVNISRDKKKIPILKYKPFTVLIFPNLLRGFCCGILSMAVTIGYFTDLLDNFSSSLLLIVTQVASILGCVAYTCFANKEKFLLLICSIGVVITMPLMVMKNTTFFLVFYGIAYIFITIINNAVPSAVVRIIDYEVSGQYNGNRMLLHTAGSFFASLFCGPMLKIFGPFLTMIITGVAQLVSGMVYFWYLRKRKI